MEHENKIGDVTIRYVPNEPRKWFNEDTRRWQNYTEDAYYVGTPLTTEKRIVSFADRRIRHWVKKKQRQHDKLLHLELRRYPL